MSLPRYYWLLEKGAEWDWSKACQSAFDTLKYHLTSAPVLAYPDFHRQFIVDVDASGDGLGAVLSQREGKAERVVAEMLGLIWTLREFRPYLYGQRFLVRTDHSCLRCLTTFKEPEWRVAWWLESLAHFDFEVEHRAGRLHGNADAMEILGPLEKTPSGKRYVLVLMDYFTKWTATFPFANMEANTFPHHPQGNGQAERFNRTLLDMLSILVDGNLGHWVNMLPFVMLAYNSCVPANREPSWARNPRATPTPARLESASTEGLHEDAATAPKMPARPIRQRVTLLPERVLLAGDATKREARPWMGGAVSGSGGNGALDVPPGLPPLVPLMLPFGPIVHLLLVDLAILLHRKVVEVLVFLV
ncbi:Retrovirus-related Pol polyprotein from transposon [Trichinella sp. T8]|nr:Retrovirus-related Pol polyprotein from transposon [Trichinella sp. T8]